MYFSVDLKVLSSDIVDILMTILPNDQEVSMIYNFNYSFM